VHGRAGQRSSALARLQPGHALLRLAEAGRKLPGGPVCCAELGATRYADHGAEVLGTMERAADHSATWRAGSWQPVERPRHAGVARAGHPFWVERAPRARLGPLLGLA
jgi:hypothetical protein